MQDWQSQGSHQYRIDADLVRWRFDGPITIPDLEVMFEVWARLAADYGTCFTVLDVREGVSVSAEGRQYIGVRNRTAPANGSTAIVGASFIIRTIVQLIHNASRLLGRSLPPAYFCSTLEEADAWILKERTRLGQNATHPS